MNIDVPVELLELIRSFQRAQPGISAHTLIELVHNRLGGSRDDLALRIGNALGELEAQIGRPERERHPLSGDARLAFWREAYLVALRARLESESISAVQAPTHLQLVAACDSAALVADLATSGHLIRCAPGKLDAILDALIPLLNPAGKPPGG